MLRIQNKRSFIVLVILYHKKALIATLNIKFSFLSSLAFFLFTNIKLCVKIYAIYRNRKHKTQQKRRKEEKMKAVITVTGKDSVGIIADVSGICAKCGANILDITQTVMSDYFAMIMLTSIDELSIDFSEFADSLSALGEKRGLYIQAMHEDIFNTMHHI